MTVQRRIVIQPANSICNSIVDALDIYALRAVLFDKESPSVHTVRCVCVTWLLALLLLPILCEGVQAN